MAHDPITKFTYLKVYAALMVLLAATVAATYIHLGPLNVLVTMAIAITKALLVIVFFMHARYSARLIWIYAALAVIWIGQLIGGVLTDIVTRG